MAGRVVLVDMCGRYDWEGEPTCAKGHKASLKCHSKRPDCSDYTPSEHYPEEVKEKYGHR